MHLALSDPLSGLCEVVRTLEEFRRRLLLLCRVNVSAAEPWSYIFINKNISFGPINTIIES